MAAVRSYAGQRRKRRKERKEKDDRAGREGRGEGEGVDKEAAKGSERQRGAARGSGKYSSGSHRLGLPANSKAHDGAAALARGELEREMGA